MLRRLKILLLCLVEDAIRGLSGPLGVRLRRSYYSRRFQQCGARLTVDAGVHIVAPDRISVGDDVWIDRGVILIAGPPDRMANVERRATPKRPIAAGDIVLGKNAHVGIGTIIQGHGGVVIGDYFTSSPQVKIYSFSNDYRKSEAGTIRTDAMRHSYILTPVFIDNNVWVGMNATIIGHSIGADTFVRPMSVVSADIGPNSVVCGNPATRLGARFRRCDIQEAVSGD